MKSGFNRLVVIFFVLLISNSSYSQVFVIPQVGLNLSEFSFAKAGFENSANVGSQLGVGFRFGKNAFFATGVYWSQYSNDIVYQDTLGLITSSTLNVKNILLPLQVGFSLYNADVFRIRLQAGINISFPIGVDDNDFNISKDNFNSSNVGAAIGFGFDIYRFVMDANFSFGMNDMLTIDDTSVGLNLYSLSIGYLIGNY